MKRALIGYGGHAREVMVQMGESLPCFVDDSYACSDTLPISNLNFDEYEVMVAIADSKIRFDIVTRLPMDAKYFTYIHPTALIMDKSVQIGNGSFIGANSILTCNIKLGNHVILNRANHIGHDCIIGNYFSMMPGSIVSGNCNIGDCVYMGTGSSTREKIKICDDVTIGLNAGVIKDITEAGVYVGTPSVKKNNYYDSYL
jgi:sugar O-acyltransferase (sialic acid O-acetyltransferase NeuD family)